MSLWATVLLSCALAFALKYLGYVIPESWLSGPRLSRVTALLPVALLSALIATQTLTGDGGTLVLDARLAAVGVAIVLLALRANFILVVLGAALTAALLRHLGWMA